MIVIKMTEKKVFPENEYFKFEVMGMIRTVDDIKDAFDASPIEFARELLDYLKENNPDYNYSLLQSCGFEKIV
jgi:hypothetical protein